MADVFIFIFLLVHPLTHSHRILYCSVLLQYTYDIIYIYVGVGVCVCVCITLRRIITLSRSRFVYHAARLDRSFKLPCPKINLKNINVDARRT